MYCGNCGHLLDETEEISFCPFCGVPIDRLPEQPAPAAQDVPTLQVDREAPRPAPVAPFNRQTPRPVPSAQFDRQAAQQALPAKKKRKTLRTVLTALIAVLLLGAILMAVLLFLEISKTDEPASTGTASEETLLDGTVPEETVSKKTVPKETASEETAPVATTQAEEQTQPEKDPAEQFREAITLIDASSFPDFRGSGYVTTFVGDLTNDGEPEFLAVYVDLTEGSERVDLHLYRMADGKPVLADQLDEPFNAVVGGNGAVSVCVFYDANGLYLYRDFSSYGGSRWGGEYLRMTVADGKLVKDCHFSEYQNPRYDLMEMTESVSGETYDSAEELEAAMLEKGLTVHAHNMYVDMNGNPVEAPTDGHIFVLYHNKSFNESGETGYIQVF